MVDSLPIRRAARAAAVFLESFQRLEPLRLYWPADTIRATGEPAPAGGAHSGSNAGRRDHSTHRSSGIALLSGSPLSLRRLTISQFLCYGARLRLSRYPIMRSGTGASFFCNIFEHFCHELYRAFP